jgi:DNA-binding NarL/FixJ family response regulator
MANQQGNMIAMNEADLIALMLRLGDADGAASAMELFQAIISGLGAETGIFMSHLRDDATRSSCRSLVVCDPVWAAEYSQRAWHLHDPWLRHAMHETEPVRSADLKPISEEEAAFATRAASMGFSSALIVPAPTCVGLSRVGVLYLGHSQEDSFNDQQAPRLRVLARALAMELHRWLHRSLRAELLARSRLTEADFDLLRHEAAGHSSKVIAAALNIEAKTVDCRFQRLNAKLDAPDRRTAVRIARLYGLI